MKKFTLYFQFVLALIFTLNSYGQILKPILADDILIRQKIQQNPQLFEDYIQYEKNLKLFISQMNSNTLLKTDTLLNGKRVLPVVVHVIHIYGPENISDAQVLDGIEKINIDYAKMNADTADTYPLFKPRAADFAIELRLAKIDPNGNCTNGIEHIYDPQTNWAYFSTMKQYVWDPTKYMNIFAVNFIYPEGMTLPEGAFIGGMSPFPPDNLLSQALTGGDADIDGVLIRQDCIGSIGTAVDMAGMGINALNRTFTHETGHYFNLYHPFQNLILGIYPAADGCPTFLAYGDEVDDTPPVAVASQNTSFACITPGLNNTCNETPNEPDMVENYMDYQFGYCTNIFTNGQKERVDATLTGIRHNLWTKENLIATGVLDTSYHPVCKPYADFTVSSRSICVGETITLTDMSYNNTPTSWNWTITGGTPSSSISQNPTISFNTPGLFAVKLVVANSAGSDSLTKTDYVRVTDPTNNTTAPIYEDFEAGIHPEWLINNDAGIGWELTDTASVSGTKCIRMRNFAGNTTGTYDEIISDGYDLTTLQNTVTLRLRFKYAYAGKIIPGTVLTDADTVYDKLIFYVSTNCGKSWVLRWQKLGALLQTTTPLETSFRPTADQWASDSVNINIYLTQHQTNFRYKFQFFSNGGNNLYIDDINIDNGTYVGMDEYSSDLVNLNVFPNPVSQNATLSFDLPDNMNSQITIYDILGNEVYQVLNSDQKAGHYEYTIERNVLGSGGCYFVKMNAGQFVFTKKFMVE